MIRRAPHTGPTYEADNASLWTCVRHMFNEGPTKPWIKGYARAQDGRGAYFAVKRHFMGTGFQNMIKANADDTISTAFYKGTSRNFTFEDYTGKLKSAFDDLYDHEEEVQNDKKVRVLLEGLQDCEPLAAACCAVRANEKYALNYEAAVNYLNPVAQRHEKKLKASRRVAAEARSRSGRDGGHRRGRSPGGFRGGRGGRGSGRGGRFGGRGRGRGGDARSAFDPRDPGRYYSDKELATFSQADWQAMHRARDESGNPRGGRGRGRGDGGRTVAGAGRQQDETHEDDGQSSVGRSLKRQKRGDGQD